MRHSTHLVAGYSNLFWM